MNSHGINKGNLLTAFPLALQKDSSATAIADGTAELLTKRLSEIDLLRIYTRIDELDEELLDILAYDFKVDWWDPNYSIEEKRRTLKSNWLVHKRMGTKAAVEAAISAIYPATKVQEWFEYGGEPYYFRLLIDLTDVLPNPEAHERVLSRVSYYKNLRSHIDEIQYIVRPREDATVRMGGCMAAVVCLPLLEIADTFDYEDTARIGGISAAQHRLPIPEIGDTLNFENTVRAGGQMAVRHSVAVPEVNDNLYFNSSMRAGGRALNNIVMPVPEINS